MYMTGKGSSPKSEGKELGIERRGKVRDFKGRLQVGRKKRAQTPGEKRESSSCLCC